MNKEKFDAVIVANGQFPTHTIPLAILHNAKHIVACDGAIVPLHLEGLEEACIIGDGDSVPEAFRRKPRATAWRTVGSASPTSAAQASARTTP